MEKFVSEINARGNCRTRGTLDAASVRDLPLPLRADSNARVSHKAARSIISGTMSRMKVTR